MYTPTEPVKIDTLYGPLYLAVIEADPHSYRDTERGNVTDFRPCIRVGTDPAFESDPSGGHHWKIKGRVYTVHREVFYEDRRHLRGGNGQPGNEWHFCPTPYGGGFRNERGTEVKFMTPTWDLMRETVITALTTYAEQNAGWEELSRHLLFLSNARSSYREADDLRRKAGQAQAEGDQLLAEAQRFAAKVPLDLYKLIRKADV